MTIDNPRINNEYFVDIFIVKRYKGYYEIAIWIIDIFSKRVFLELSLRK